MLCKEADKRPSMKEILEEPFVRTKIEEVETEWKKKKIGRFEVVKKFQNEFGYAKKLRQQRMDNMKSVGRKRNFKKDKGRPSKPNVEIDERKNMLDDLMKGKKISHLLRDADKKMVALKIEREKRGNDLTKGNHQKERQEVIKVAKFSKRKSQHVKKNRFLNRSQNKNERNPRNGKGEGSPNRSRQNNDAISNANVHRMVKSKRVIPKIYNAAENHRISKRGCKSGANSPAPQRERKNIHFLKRKPTLHKPNRKIPTRPGSKNKKRNSRGANKNVRGKSRPKHNGYDISKDIYLKEVMKNFGGRKSGPNQQRVRLEKEAKQQMMQDMEQMYFQNMNYGAKKEDKLAAFFEDEPQAGQIEKRPKKSKSQVNHKFKQQAYNRQIFGDRLSKSGGSSSENDEFAFSYSNNYNLPSVPKPIANDSHSRRNLKIKSKRNVPKSKRDLKQDPKKERIRRKQPTAAKKNEKFARQKTQQSVMNKSGRVRAKHSQKKIKHQMMNKSCNIRNYYNQDQNEAVPGSGNYVKAELPFEQNEDDFGGPHCNPENYIMNSTGELVLRPTNLKKKSRALTRSVILKNIHNIHQDQSEDQHNKSNNDNDDRLEMIIHKEEAELESENDEDKEEGGGSGADRNQEQNDQMRKGLKLIKKKKKRELSRVNLHMRERGERRADLEETKVPKQVNPREAGRPQEKKDFEKWYSEEYFKECLEEDGEFIAQNGLRRRGDAHPSQEIIANQQPNQPKTPLDNTPRPDPPINEIHQNSSQKIKEASLRRSKSPRSGSRAEDPKSRYISSNQKLHPSFSCGYTVSNKRNFFGRQIQRIIKKKREASPNERIKKRRLLMVDKRRKGSDLAAEQDVGFMGRLTRALKGKQRGAVRGEQRRCKMRSVACLDKEKAGRRFEMRGDGRVQNFRIVYVEMGMTGSRRFSVGKSTQGDSVRIRSPPQTGELHVKYRFYHI